jgi:hypothetical protein
MDPVTAIILGKFIYTPRSSQPIGIGRIAFMSETDMRKVRIKNPNSAVSNFGLRKSRLLPVFDSF